MPASAISGVATSHDVPGGSICGTMAAHMPPSASAPSPPITTSPTCAGSATQSAVSISGDARSSVFCHANDEPNAPWKMSPSASSAGCPCTSRNSAKSASALSSASTVGTAGRTLRISLAAGALRRIERLLHVPECMNQIWPTTPATR